MVKGFLMTSGGVALAMVPFALIGQLDFTAIILAVVSTLMVGGILCALAAPAAGEVPTQQLHHRSVTEELASSFLFFR